MPPRWPALALAIQRAPCRHAAPTARQRAPPQPPLEQRRPRSGSSRSKPRRAGRAEPPVRSAARPTGHPARCWTALPPQPPHPRQPAARTSAPHQQPSGRIGRSRMQETPRQAARPRRAPRRLRPPERARGRKTRTKVAQPASAACGWGRGGRRWVAEVRRGPAAKLRGRRSRAVPRPGKSAKETRDPVHESYA